MPARPELRRGAGRQGGGDGDEGKEMEGEEALSVRCRHGLETAKVACIWVRVQMPVVFCSQMLGFAEVLVSEDTDAPKSMLLGLHRGHNYLPEECILKDNLT